MNGNPTKDRRKTFVQGANLRFYLEVLLDRAKRIALLWKRRGTIKSQDTER